MFPKDLNIVSGDSDGWIYHLGNCYYPGSCSYVYMFGEDDNDFLKDPDDRYKNFYYLIEDHLFRTFRKRIYRK